MDQPEADQLTDGGEQYTYRNDQWTTGAGYCVSTTYGHKLTLKFYEKHGRCPRAGAWQAPARGRGATAARARSQVGRSTGARGRASRAARRDGASS